MKNFEDFNPVIPAENEGITIKADKAREDFKRLYSLNLNDQVETKTAGGTQLSYLNWATAWKELKLAYGNPSYRIILDKNGLPYHASEVGVFVMVEVTAGGMTYQQHLPILDSKNMPMRLESYKYSTYNRYEKKYEEKTVAACSSFDINSGIMRALCKCISLFGIGLYLYEGNDMPNQLPSENMEDTMETPVASAVLPQASQDPQEAEAPRQTRRRKSNTPTSEDPVPLMKDLINSMQSVPELVNLYKIHAREVSANPEIMALFTKRRQELENAA